MPRRTAAGSTTQALLRDNGRPRLKSKVSRCPRVSWIAGGVRACSHSPVAARQNRCWNDVTFSLGEGRILGVISLAVQKIRVSRGSVLVGAWPLRKQRHCDR